MRYINLTKASFNLEERETKIQKLAERIIKISAEEENFGIGGSITNQILIIPKPHDRKWGHFTGCKCLIPNNHVITEVYHIKPKVSDLKITINEDFVYITSKSNNFRVGEALGGVLEMSDGIIKMISKMVKYLLVNGYKELFTNKDYAEISFEEENSKKCFLNDFYNENVLFKNVSDNIFGDIIAHAKERGLNLEEYNPEGEFGCGIINRKLILSSSQRWNCAEKMEDSEIYIEYNDSDLKLGFRNIYHNIYIDHYIYKKGLINGSNTIDDAVIMMAETAAFLIKNGPVKYKHTIINKEEEELENS